MQLGIEANGQTVNLAVGDTVELVLPENRGAGFQWQVASSGDPFIAVDDGSYAAASGAHGRPGVHSWIIRGVESGEGHLELVSRRPWEGDRPPARTFSLVVHVRAKPTKP